jgi:hypothetical protein
MPGRHVFKHGGLVTGKPQISNTNDAPNEAKAMAIRLLNAKTYARRANREPLTSCWRESHLRLHGARGKRFPERPGL